MKLKKLMFSSLIFILSITFLSCNSLNDYQISIDNVDITYHSFAYHVHSESIGEISDAWVDTIKVYSGDDLIYTEETPEYDRTVEGLLPSTDYLIQINYTFTTAKNDSVSKTYEYEFTTEEAPVVNLSLDTTFTSSRMFTFQIDGILDDMDVTSVLFNVEGTEIYSKTAESIHSFNVDGLEPDTTYVIDASITYDIYDGNGPQIYNTSITIQTEVPDPVEIINILTTESSVNFDVIINDNFTGTNISVTLVDSEYQLVATLTDFLNGVFVGLDPDTVYWIHVEYDYADNTIPNGQKYYRCETLE